MTNKPAESRHRWAAFGATVAGPSHSRVGLANEDAVAWRCDPAGRWASVAVADGHGHSLAVRAGTGARLAVADAVELAEAFCAGHDGSAGDANPPELASALRGNWLRSIEQDALQSPIGDEELNRSGQATMLAAHPELAYGTTLVVALAVGELAFAYQIGDGEVVAVGADGRVHRPLPTDGRLVGTRTTSMASRTALEDFRAGPISTPGVSLEVIVAASDGYVNSFATDEGWVAAGADLWSLLHSKGVDAVHGALPGWLQSTSAEGAGDDATVAVLFDQAALGDDPGGTGEPADGLGEP